MDDRTAYRREFRSYVIGLVSAVLLSTLAFVSVLWGGLSRTPILWIIAAAGIVQIVVHFRFFLHIDLSRSKRDDLQLILFSFLIILLMAGGTIWILADLEMRMM